MANPILNHDWCKSKPFLVKLGIVYHCIDSDYYTDAKFAVGIIYCLPNALL